MGRKKRKRIYTTQEWNGYGKQNYYRNEYDLEGDEVIKSRSHRYKFFNGDENEWITESDEVCRWNKDDSDLPGWLANYI